MKNWTVRVHASPGTRISLQIHQFMAGGFLNDQRTDSEGWTTFHFNADHGANLTVYKDGQPVTERASISENPYYV